MSLTSQCESLINREGWSAGVVCEGARYMNAVSMIIRVDWTRDKHAQLLISTGLDRCVEDWVARGEHGTPASTLWRQHHITINVRSEW